jgi:ABC-type antimicrobial peptide transport system permease subunit
LVPTIRQAVLEMDRGLPLAAPRTMGRVLREATGERQFLLTMVSLFAVIAMILAIAGILGTIFHNVTQRTREIGIRIALGAHHRRILMMVLRHGSILVGVGIGLGIVLVVSFAAVFRSQLYGVGPLSPVYTGIAVVLVAMVTLAATMLPARRASRVDPMEALRFE